ncbi:MAG: PfkB domain protein [Firmicutes bacterium]|nr:PfkB domain protein [Bacillota bacterium]
MDKELLALSDRLHGHKIMVIGDIVADVYMEGKISRISREAPVLVLEHCGETVVPGGAANVVHNAATLGGSVYAVGVIGDDAAGQQLVKVLGEKKVNTVGFIVDQTRPTVTKTRVMAGGLATVRQQVVRIDRESKDALNAAVEARILEYIKSNIRAMAVVVMSDYGSGAVSPAVRRLVLDECRAANIPCIVDSRYDILSFAGVTLVKQNEAEAAAAVGYTSLDGDKLLAAGKELLAKLGAKVVMITQGAEGMSLFEADRVTHIPVSNVSEVYDVSGAGDTVVVATALALAAGASYVEAAQLANFAAGVVVRKPGTATTTVTELKEAIGEYHENCR